MRSGSVAQERMRFVMGLTVIGAALLACGVILVLIGSTLRLKSPHDGRGFMHAGEAVAICGLAFGVGLLVVLVMDLADRAGRGGPGKARKGSGPQRASEGLIPLPSPETGLAELRQEPVVELKLASRYPRPDQTDNRWQPDAGNASYPPAAGNGSYPQAGGSWSPGPAFVWSPRDDWDSSGEGGWSPAEADNWAGDARDGGGPAGQDGWGHGGQQEWAAAGQGGWDSPGQEGWDSPGQEGWGQGGQQQWAPDGRGGWVRAGQDGWGPAGPGDWGQGGQQHQQEWAAAGQGDLSGGGLPEWAAAGQGDSSGGGLSDWAAAGQGDLSGGGLPEWAPGGQGGWVAGGDPDWGAAEPAASPVGPAAPGQSAHTTDPGAGQPESVDGPQFTNVAGPGATGPAPTQDAPRATAGEPAPDIAVTKSVESDDTGDFDDTAPLPVIRDVSPSVPKTAEDEPDPAPAPGKNQSAPLSVFEPAPKKSVFEPRPRKSVFGPGPNQAPERDLSSDRDGRPDNSDRSAQADPLPAETRAKLEQIKDLYLTAEAIGEDALVKHFDQLSQRQRSLIREFFEQSGLGSRRTSALLGDDGTSPPSGDSTQDGASLPG